MSNIICSLLYVIPHKKWMWWMDWRWFATKFRWKNTMLDNINLHKTHWTIHYYIQAAAILLCASVKSVFFWILYLIYYIIVNSLSKTAHILLVAQYFLLVNASTCAMFLIYLFFRSEFSLLVRIIYYYISINTGTFSLKNKKRWTKQFSVSCGERPSLIINCQQCFAWFIQVWNCIEIILRSLSWTITLNCIRIGKLFVLKLSETVV